MTGFSTQKSTNLQWYYTLKKNADWQLIQYLSGCSHNLHQQPATTNKARTACKATQVLRVYHMRSNCSAKLNRSVYLKRSVGLIVKLFSAAPCPVDNLATADLMKQLAGTQSLFLKLWVRGKWTQLLRISTNGYMVIHCRERMKVFVSWNNISCVWLLMNCDVNRMTYAEGGFYMVEDSFSI